MDSRARVTARLVGAAEIQQVLGVSRQRVNQITTHDNFPAPLAVLRMGKVWEFADVEAWADARGRTLAPLDAPVSSTGSAEGTPST